MARRRHHARCTRCKTLVPIANALPFPRGGRLPFYCSAHQDEILSEKTFRRSKHAAHTIYFKTFIPAHLEPRTQILLRHFMHSTPAKSDGPGYIYALELQDDAHLDLVHIKVGRTNDIARRLSEHRRRCPSFEPFLLGHYPAKARLRASYLVPYCDLLERLVHLELTDLAVKAHPAGGTTPHTRCVDCGSHHVEIFTFRRLRGHSYGREWVLIIRPILERWGRFVSKYV
ncbi:hypothetical protein LXA43DRAFT_898469 [Ganoderma leucocontextum]|nr:hypothetical protein LXA43DRAFT_898469 [Ganoderma leucocontextum]